MLLNGCHVNLRLFIKNVNGHLVTILGDQYLYMRQVSALPDA